MSLRAKGEVERRLEVEACRLKDETAARREAEQAVKSAELATLQAVSSKAEWQRALSRFQEASTR